MDDALAVGGIQAVGNLNGEIKQRVNWQGRATCPLTRVATATGPLLRCAQDRP